MAGQIIQLCRQPISNSGSARFQLLAVAGCSLTNRSRAGGCVVSNYPFLTLKERDIEAGLDYFYARYYSNGQGRFTSVDPENYQAMRDMTDPQSWNAYSYVNNNPLSRVDPDGRGFFTKLKNKLLYGVWGEEEDVQREEDKRRNILLQEQKENEGPLIIENLGGDLIRVDPANMTRAQVFSRRQK